MRLDETALGDYLFSNVETAPLRHETLTLYNVPSDGGDFDRYLAGYHILTRRSGPDGGSSWETRHVQGRR